MGLQVDMATQNKTRPTCATFKVGMDLMGDFPNRRNMQVGKKIGKIVEKWVEMLKHISCTKLWGKIKKRKKGK